MRCCMEIEWRLNKWNFELNYSLLGFAANIGNVIFSNVTKWKTCDYTRVQRAFHFQINNLAKQYIFLIKFDIRRTKYSLAIRQYIQFHELFVNNISKYIRDRRIIYGGYSKPCRTSLMNFNQRSIMHDPYFRFGRFSFRMWGFSCRIYFKHITQKNLSLIFNSAHTPYICVFFNRINLKIEEYHP